VWTGHYRPTHVATLLLCSRPTVGGIKRCCDSVCPPICLSVLFPSSETVHFGATMNTNRKPRVGSRTRWSARLEVAETSRAKRTTTSSTMFARWRHRRSNRFHKRWLGGCTMNMETVIYKLIHTAAPYTTQTGPFCRVWSGGVNWVWSTARHMRSAWSVCGAVQYDRWTHSNTERTCRADSNHIA